MQLLRIPSQQVFKEDDVSGHKQENAPSAARRRNMNMSRNEKESGREMVVGMQDIYIRGFLCATP